MRIRFLGGLAAGFAGGLLACWVMGKSGALVVRAWDYATGQQASEQEQGDDSTAKAAAAISRAVFHRPLTPEQEKAAAPLVHYGFGSTMGAIYGAAAATYPAVARGAGLPFGVAVWLGAHVIMVPAMGLSKPVNRSSSKSEVAEFLAHLVYGVVTDFVRAHLMKIRTHR